VWIILTSVVKNVHFLNISICKWNFCKRSKKNKNSKWN